MPDEKYVIPENPAYQAGNIRKLQDGDPASASQTINPLVQKILESVAYVYANRAPLDEGGKIPEENLPVQGGLAIQAEAPENTKLGWIDTGNGGILKYYDAVSESWKPVAPIDENGKIPEEYLPVLGGHKAQATAPSNTNLLWIDTANDNLIKFYDAASETWKPATAVWG